MPRRLILNPFLHLAILALVAGQAFAEDNSEARYSGVSRIVVFADVHGAYQDLTRLLRQTGIIDADGNWSGGNSYLVSLGDLAVPGAVRRRSSSSGGFC